MSTRLILIRHAASHHKEQGIVAGPQSCRGLTDVGRQQAARLAERLLRDKSLVAPTVLYASMLPRAIETAQILATAFGPGIQVRQECDFCTWHIPARYDGMAGEEFQKQCATPGGGVFLPFQAGNESWAELVGRTGRGLWRLAQRHQDETTIIVAHSETICASLIVFGNLPLTHSFDVEVTNASITEWTTDGDTQAWPPPRWTMARFNDAAHLESLEAS